MSDTAKEIIFEEEARQKLATGIGKLADVVACTLGPKGRSVGLEKSWGAPSVTNDGKDITGEIELADTYENMGVAMAKEAVNKIKDKCGDGTTTGTLLLRSLVDGGIKYVTSGASPILLKRGIEKGVAAVVDSIEKSATSVTTDADTRKIALVAASGDESIGGLIAEAFEKVGKEGVITIEEAKGTETTIEIVEGMRYDRGYLSPYFCTNADKMIAEMENPKILLVDGKISSIHDLLPILQTTASSGQELLIISEDIEGDALSTLVVNRLRGSLKVAATKAPGFGDKRKAMLADLAALTGATVVSEETGTSLKDVQADALGSAEKVSITKDHTTLVNGAGSSEAVAARVKQIDAEYESTTSSYDQEKLLERKAKLSGGVAVIRVGANTEPELKNRKQRFEDSLNSTQAAIEEGTVPGGGVALLHAASAANSLDLSDDEALGAKLVAKACEAPTRQLIRNVAKEDSVYIDVIRKKGGTYGFNVVTEEVEDLILAGIVDPVKVVKAALIHASSVAGIVLISEALIADAPEEDEA